MTFTAPGPLSPTARRFRALLLVALLLGSLFPSVGGVNLVGVAALAAAPLIVYEVLRFLPVVHRVVLFVVPLFAVIVIHALVIVPTSEYGQGKLSRFLTLTLISALAACLLRDRESVVTFARFWILAAVVLAGFTLSGWTGDARADAFESNPVWLARAFATGIIAALWLWWRKLHKRLPMVLASGLMLFALLATGSRGPLVAAVIAVVVLSIVGNKMKFKRLSLVVLAGAGTILALLKVPALQDSRLAQMLDSGELADTTRGYFLDATLPVIFANPGGVGFGNWSYATGSVHHQWPHNLFLEVFAEMGSIAGIALVLTVMIVGFKLARRAGEDPAAAGVLAMLVAETCAVSVSGDLNARTFFFLLTLGTFVSSWTGPRRGESRTPKGESAPKRLQAPQDC